MLKLVLCKLFGLHKWQQKQLTLGSPTMALWYECSRCKTQKPYILTHSSSKG
jgi:hypothetical protein